MPILILCENSTHVGPDQHLFSFTLKCQWMLTFSLKDRIDIGDVVVEHLPGEEMGAANMLSKPLQGAQFQKKREDLTHWSEA